MHENVVEIYCWCSICAVEAAQIEHQIYKHLVHLRWGLACRVFQSNYFELGFIEIREKSLKLRLYGQENHTTWNQPEPD